jgi:glucose/arabinose dehydrogenase
MRRSFGETGCKVVRLLFDSTGKPTGEYEDFMTGFVISDQQAGDGQLASWSQDGSLFVTRTATEPSGGDLQGTAHRHDEVRQ